MQWWDGLSDGDVGLCVPVRMGLLRLLCNRRVMGASVQAPEAAWDAVEQLRNDPRMTCLTDTPTGHDDHWRANVTGREPTPNVWTDAWLAALAQTLDKELVSFDRGFRAYRNLLLKLLALNESTAE